MGIYVLNKSICSLIPDNLSFGFDDLMIAMLEKKMMKILIIIIYH